MDNVLKGRFDANLYELVHELREAWFDSSQQQEIAQRILRTYGDETLKTALSAAVVSAGWDAAAAEAQCNSLQDLVGELGLSWDEIMKRVQKM